MTDGPADAPCAPAGDSATRRAIEAVWRIEAARVIARLTRMVRDVGLAEDLAGDALVAALERWPMTGVPENPGAWLMAAASRRAVDGLRRDAITCHPALAMEARVALTLRLLGGLTTPEIARAFLTSEATAQVTTPAATDRYRGNRRLRVVPEPPSLHPRSMPVWVGMHDSAR